jgi:hypothetical protein
VSMNSNEDVVRKIEACLRLATEGSGATEAEMMLALQRANTLMTKYGISMVDVNAFKDNAEDAAKKTWKKGRSGSLGTKEKRQHLDRFEKTLIVAIGEFTGTVGIIYKVYDASINRKRNQVYFIGDERDVAIASATLWMVAKAARNAAKNAVGPGWKASHLSFCDGYAEAVYRKVMEMQKVNHREVEVDESTYALVQQSKKDWIKGLLDEMGVKNAKQSKPRGERDWDAFYRGMDEGAKADINIKDKLGS